MRRLRTMIAVLLIGALVGAPEAGKLLGNMQAVARGADSVLSVYPSTTATGVAAQFTLTGTLPAGIVGLAYSNCTIDVGFDVQDTSSTAMYVPLNPSATYVSVGGSPISVYSLSVSGVHHYLISNVSLSSSTLTVSFALGVGLRPLQDGTHYVTLTVLLGSTVLTSFSGTYQSSGGTVTGSINLQAVNLDSAQLGSAASLGFDFISGSTLYPSDQIMIQFPTGFTLPGSIPVSAVGMIETALGEYVNVFGSSGISASGSLLTLTIPQPDATLGNNTSYFDAGVTISVRFGITAGFMLPTTAGTYTFQMWTSRQTTPATKTITLGTGVTSAQLTASPLIAGAAIELAGSFVTSASGAMSAGQGTVFLSFPTSFSLPATIPAGTVMVNSQAASVVAVGHLLKVTVPTAINATSTLTFSISSSAGLVMPPAVAGGYAVSLCTSADAIPVPCAAISPQASTLSAIVVLDTPAVHGAQAAVSVTFNAGPGGALKAGDTISLVFPAGFTVPASIDKTQVTIKTPATATSGVQPTSVQCVPASQSIVLTLPSGSSIPAGASVAVSLPAVITNPAAGGSFTIKVSTSKEMTAVDSASFTIYNNPISTLRMTPTTADGKAGYYVTQPSFVLTVEGPAGITLSAFYRIDDTGAFLPYDLRTSPAVKVSAGKHAVYYYSQDSLGNVEPTRSQQLVVDLTDPVITVSSPAQKGVVVQATTTVSGKVADMDLASVRLTVNGQTATVGTDGAFSAPVSFSREGDNTITLAAASASGRTTTLNVSVNYIARVTMSLVIGSSTININNEFKTIEAAPFISKKGVTMVPLRFISEAFRATVAWDPVFKSVTIELNGKTMRIQVGFMTADVNGKPLALQDAPVIVNGRTFVPLRFIAENFGAQVDWNGALKMVSIIYPKP